MNNLLINNPKFIGSCCENSFIIIDCRIFPVNTEEKSQFSVENIGKYGVDSTLFVENVEGFSIAIDVFERDGSQSDSCGNGILLVATLLNLDRGSVRLSGSVVTLEGDAERQAAYIDLVYADVVGMTTDHSCIFTRVGEPHIIYMVDDTGSIDLHALGELHQKDFQAGVNVDVLQKVSDSKYLIRTYERGVLDETKSCGTGSLSSFLAISYIHNKMYTEPIEFKSAGGSHWVSRKENTLKLETLKSFCKIRNF